MGAGEGVCNEKYIAQHGPQWSDDVTYMYMTKAGAQQVLPGLHSREHQFFKLEKVSLSRVTRLSLNTLKCGSKRDERYDSTGLLSDK